jgi:hypothetical protein
MVGFTMDFQRGGGLRAGVELISPIDRNDTVNVNEPVPGFSSGAGAGSCTGSTGVIAP